MQTFGVRSGVLVLCYSTLVGGARTSKYTCSEVIEGDTFSYESCTPHLHSISGEIAHTGSQHAPGLKTA